MNILASSLVEMRPDGVFVRLLNRRETFGPFASLNDLRLALPDFDFIPRGDLDDFGRGSGAVRCSMLAALFAAGDAASGLPSSTAVVGWNGRGCTAENVRYWQDYVSNGRTAGRGGLFVATLPTIPFCEAAIALGLRGPSAYFQTDRSTDSLFGLIAARPEGLYLTGEITDSSACFFLLDNASQGETAPRTRSLEELFRAMAEGRR